MAVAIRAEFPQGPGTEMHDGVSAAMNVAADPPEGLIFHWAGEVEDKWTITDAWETRQTYDSFVEERLSPAIQSVSGMDKASGPQPTLSEFAVHNFVKP